MGGVPTVAFLGSSQLLGPGSELSLKLWLRIADFVGGTRCTIQGARAHKPQSEMLGVHQAGKQL